MPAYPWNVLRPIADTAVSIDAYIKVLVFLLAIGMFVLSFLAFKKTDSRKFFFIAIAFFFFALKWAIKLLDIFVSPGSFFSDSSENVFELLIFAALFLAVFGK